MARKKQRIYIDRWLSFHPHSTPAPSDFYYLRLCNETFSLMEENAYLKSAGLLNREEIEDLACFIVCYLEDVISGPGLWQAFTAQVNELYGTYLPFCNLDPDDYYPDEINIEDISFLIWYFVSMAQYDETIISPEALEWSDLPDRIFEIFEREYELAPENPTLKEHYTVSPKEDNFFVLKEKMRSIMLDSWLLHFQGKELVDMINEDSRGIKVKMGRRRIAGSCLYMIRSIHIFSQPALLCLPGRGRIGWLISRGRTIPFFMRSVG